MIIVEKNVTDIKINGHGSSTGGKYNSVTINGSGSIGADLECVTMRVNGQCNVDGSVKADSVKINGNSSIKGNLEAEKVNVKGMVDIGGNLSVEEAKTQGNISIDGDCNAEIFSVDGMFAVEGFLNAGELELNLYGPSRAREIGGEKITVKKSGKFGFGSLKSIIMPFGHTKELTVDTIEGDDIHIENTQAKVVRGNNIELGPGCEVELVEYKDSFKQDEKANVGTHTKVGY